MALNSFQLFLGQIQTAPEVLKIRVLQIVFDILMVHENDFMSKERGAVGNNYLNCRSVLIFYRVTALSNFYYMFWTPMNRTKCKLYCASALQSLSLLESSPMTRWVLMNSRRISKCHAVQVLSSLVVAYLSPGTVNNQEIRQCLSYFFPVFCYSSAINQRRTQRQFIPLFERLAQATRDVEEDQEMVSPAQMAAIFVDWTDPQKAM